MDSVATDSLTFTWLAAFPRSHASGVHHLRAGDAVEIAFHGEEIWLRGETDDGELPHQLVRLSGVEIWWLSDDGKLAPLDSYVPKRDLPELDWKPIAEISRPTISGTALPAATDSKCQIRPVRDSGAETQPNALLTTLTNLEKWVSESAEFRFAGLTFAASENGDALVRGEPLPSVPGTQLVEKAGVSLPLGQRTEPPVAPKVLARAFDLKPGDLAVFHPDGTSETIPASNFVPLTRASVRLTGAPESP